MDTKSKKSDDFENDKDINTDFQNQDIDNKTKSDETIYYSDADRWRNAGKVKKVATSLWTRALAFILACVMSIVFFYNVFSIFEMRDNENQNSSGYNFGSLYDYSNTDSFANSTRFSQKNYSFYEMLYVTCNAYLRNLDDDRKFTESEYLLDDYKEYMAEKISFLKDIGVGRDDVKLSSENGLPYIESEFYDYYICVDNDPGKVMTNINKYRHSTMDEHSKNQLKKKGWVLREKNKVTIDEDYYDTVYYYGENFGGFTSQLYFLGESGKDNYGRYFFSTYNSDDIDSLITTLYNFDTSDSKKEFIIDGEKQLIVSEDEWKKYLNRVYDNDEYDEGEYEYDNGGYYLDEYYDRYGYVSEDDNGEKIYTIYQPLEELGDYKFTDFNDNDITIMFWPKEEKLAAVEKSFNEKAAQTNQYLKNTIVCFAIAAVCVIYLIIVCGYSTRPKTDKDKWNYSALFGWWNTEFLAGGIVLGVMCPYVIGFDYSEISLSVKNIFDVNLTSSYLIMSAVVTLFAALVLGMLLGIISKIKKRRFFADFFIIQQFGRFLGAIKKLFKSIWKSFMNVGILAKYDEKTLAKKLYTREWIFIAITACVGLIGMITFYNYWYGTVHSWSFVYFILWGYVIYAIWYFVTQFKIYKAINTVNNHIEKMSLNEDFEEDISEGSLLYDTNQMLRKISENVQETVEKQIQSERMKVELVTNVSHDLKTPLTSIISYIDLLKTEDLSPEAMDYVTILDQKADKLKNIVSDVFSLAKATSGVDVQMEKLDVVMLLNQAIADADDKISNSGRVFKADMQPKSAMIMADGNKLCRVFQNIIDNSLNYSMAGTRIFLKVSEQYGCVTIELKNTASYEMNFTPEEITERFTRGDESRTDGGNGLGLSIAKSFTEACGGLFSIVLDGDVFKVIIKFQKISDEDSDESIKE